MASRSFPHREHIEKTWSSFRSFLLSIRADGLSSLGEHQIRILSDFLHHPSRECIARSRGIRRDTLDKKLGVIRERLGLENHLQLLRALSDMQARNHVTPPQDPDKNGTYDGEQASAVVEPRQGKASTARYPNFRHFIQEVECCLVLDLL